MTCNRDCFNCIYKDCYANEVTSEETREQDLRDREARYDRLLTNTQRKQFRYNETEKGRERMRRYNHSDKGKEARKRYDQSEKGKERFRRYYQKKKLEKELQLS